jgi:LDH2 family malate/lactate/ureidoglycolate dehydrogenase
VIRVVRIDPGALFDWTAALLRQAGLDAPDAEEVSRHLVFADLRGIDTHGTSRLKIYLERLESGAIARTAPVIERETAVSALVDGRAGFGQLVCRFATELTIEKARRAGIAAVAVRNSNHCGCMSYYTLQMAEAGLVGLAVTNTNAGMPPFGGMDGFFGTNPISVAAPAGEEEPFVLDMATSVVAFGKIFNAAREGKPIPAGWAITADGQPALDPKEAAWVLPMAGPKGSGLAMLVETLGGVLPGALLSVLQTGMYEAPLVPQENGQFFLAFRPDLFRPEEEFRAAMDDLIRRLRTVRPAPGHDRVLSPGDLERLTAQRYSREGIPVQPGQQREFAALGDRYGRPFPAG